MDGPLSVFSLSNHRIGDQHKIFGNVMFTFLKLRQTLLEISSMINSGDDDEKLRYTESQVIVMLIEVHAGMRAEDNQLNYVWLMAQS